MGKKGLRVVIDTNLVLSGLVFGGKVAALRYAWQNNFLIPLISKLTVTELIRVLAYPKFNLTASEQEDLLADYLHSIFRAVSLNPNFITFNFHMNQTTMNSLFLLPSYGQ
jgi:predicted nucleic acid-binding protein